MEVTNRHLGGKKTKANLLARDPDYYKKLGSLGGKTNYGNPKGFAAMDKAKVIAAAKRAAGLEDTK